ncbi:MAG: amidohydrolase, partial [Alphaproteobacteria bacterium]|nr:amidohydrolase [Alphaproteobacteria bacterium]
MPRHARPRRSVTAVCVTAVCVLALTPAASVTARAQHQGGADIVVLDAKVFTARDGADMAEGFAIAGDRFVAVGTSADMRRHVDSHTRVIDLGGAFVVPGLGDGHFHNEGGGPGVDLSRARSIADVLAAVAEAVAAAEAGSVIVSNSDWHEAQLAEQRLPRKADLDQVSPSHPVVLVRGGHEYILNSAALRRFNIDRDTPDPPGGAITRDPSGEPDGELVDAARRLVTLAPPRPVTVEDVLTTQRKVNAFGITSVRVPGSYKGNDFFHALDTILAARRQGVLTLRWNILLPGFFERDPARIREMIEKSPLRQDEGDEWVRVGGVKLMVDGGFEGGHMSRPYAGEYGKGGAYSGLTLVPPDAFTAVVRTINELGWRAATHAVGDAAIDEVLDAYEAADADHPIAGRRFSIEHGFVVREDQLPRIKRLELVLSVQDHLYLAAPVLRKYLGSARASAVTPVRTYRDRGFLVVGGTDSPVVPFNPFFEIYHFLTRDTITDGVYGADQAVTSRADLLRMITID